MSEWWNWYTHNVEVVVDCRFESYLGYMELKDIKGETRSLYDVTIIESVDGGYVGFLKDKPGVMSMGETKDELIENMRDALRTMTAYEHERSING